MSAVASVGSTLGNPIQIKFDNVTFSDTYPEHIPFKQGLSHEATHCAPVESKDHPFPGHSQTSGDAHFPLTHPLENLNDN